MNLKQTTSFARGVVVLVLLATSAATRGDFPRTNGLLTEVVAKRKPSANARKIAKVRDDLARNLDGKGGGFIRGWAFDSKVFTLTVDESRYQPNAVYAAAITARSIFDMNGVPLPKKLIIRDRSGAVLGEGPFANVPKIVD
jgi:hypothetical protein